MGWYCMHTHRGEKIEVTHLHLVRIFNESFDDQVLIFLRHPTKREQYKSKRENYAVAGLP